MEPISSNRPANLLQPKEAEEKQVRDDTQRNEQANTQPAPSADRFTSSNPVSELNLQRSQVVQDLGRAQQAGLEPDSAPVRNDGNVRDEAQAEALSRELQQQIREQPGNALDAQAQQASRDTALTLFQ